MDKAPRGRSSEREWCSGQWQREWRLLLCRKSGSEIIGGVRNWFGDEAEGLPTDASLRALCPKAFAGSWIGNAGELVVAYTSEPGRHAREAEQRLGIKHRITAVLHRRSASELERVMDEIDRAHEEWATRGAVISSLGVDSMRNVVDVTVEQLTDETRREFADRYGEAVALSEGRVEAV